MIKVRRMEKPSSLVSHANVWKDELLQEVQNKGEYKVVLNKFKEKYRQEDIKQTLEEMYNYKCCYCEAGIGESSYGRIEHLKPKSLPLFHHLSFEWSNLHWCCEICNTNKGAKWDNEIPILDPTIDNPNSHLQFDLTECKLKPKNDSKRAETTINHTKLNRSSLLRGRRKLREKTIQIIAQLKATPSGKDDLLFKQSLLEMANKGEPHSLFLSELVEEFI